MDNLKGRTISALVWSAVERFGQQGSQFVITIVLARLLTPQDFGLIGLVMVFVVIGEALIQQGFGQSLIQKTTIDEDDLTTVFLFTTFLSVILYGLVFLSSGAIARFYQTPALQQITRVVALVIILDALVVIQRAQFEKRLEFKKLSIASFSATVVSGVVGISLAFYGFGVWAIALQRVLQKGILAGILWGVSTWVPRGRFVFAKFRSLFTYGWKLQVAGVLEQIFKNIHALIIGRFFAVDLVGYYSQAKKLKDLPMENFSVIVGKVTFPAFSSIKDDHERLRIGYRNSIQVLTLVSAPVMFGMLAVAERMIPVLLGEHWLPAIPFFQLLCFAGVLYPLVTTNTSILKVTGYTGQYLLAQLVSKALMIISIVVAIRWGVYALVIGQVVVMYFTYMLMALIAGPHIKYSLFQQIADVGPGFVLAAAMAVIVYLVPTIVHLDSIGLMLVLQIFIGGLLYIGGCHVFRLRAWSYIFSTMRNKASW